MEATAAILSRPFEHVSEGNSFTVTRRDMPWLPGESEIIKLKRVSLHGGGAAYIASCTRGKKLVDAASELDPHRSKITNNLFNTRIAEFIKGYSANVKMLVHSVTERPIYYVGNHGGQRVYFIRFDNKDGIPVIVRIASCDKSTQNKVLSVLSDQSIANVKKFGRL